MDTANSSDARTDPSRFDAAIRTRAWSWLDALSRRLQLDIQLVDEQGDPKGASSAPARTALPRLVASGAPELRMLVASAITLRARQTTTLRDLRVYAYPLNDGAGVIGAVLIAHSTAGQGGPVPDVDFDITSQSVVQGIEAHLRSAPVSSQNNFDELASLGHVLDAAAAQGSDRDIVSAFAAALAFWSRIDVYGYVTTTNGMFAAEVWPPVDMPPQMATTVAVSALPAGNTLTRLSAEQIQALGLLHAQDVVVARVPDGDFPWLLVFCGRLAASDLVRLSLYVRLLEQLIRTLTSEAIVKLVTAVCGHLLEHGDTVDAALSAALDALNGSIGMSASALTVTTGSGAPLLQIGQVDAFQRSADAAVGFRLAILRRMPNQYNLSLVVTPSEGRRVTRHQRDVADEFVNLVDAWVRRILPQLQGRDRRTASRRFDEVLDRFAGQALERGIPVAVVVLFVTDAACFPRLTQQWIARIRGTMRASDIVGALGEGEIGLMLHDTSHSQAEVVAQRLLKMLQPADDGYRCFVATGVASRAPGVPGAASVAAEARTEAISKATASSAHHERPSESRDAIRGST